MRTITEIILHCTATPEGREVSRATIRQWHIARGFNNIGYHYLIHLDGTVEQGRPIENIGAHCQGHNAHSIGIAYIGGTDSTGKPKDTRTNAQKAALIQLLQQLKQQYPQATIHGHQEYASKACPSFDVQKWLNETTILEHLKNH